jgi:hypothetical protein
MKINRLASILKVELLLYTLLGFTVLIIYLINTLVQIIW